MKMKIYTRPVSITLTDEMFERIKEITDFKNIGISDYIRVAIQEKLTGKKATTIITQEE